MIVSLLCSVLVFTSACNGASIMNNEINQSSSKETLYVYEDGKMRLDSKYVDKKDVVIYSDGQGGEKAAVKVRVPIHSDFYRDSIIVVRVVNEYDGSISQSESENTGIVN